MPDTYDVKITSSAETRALENYQKLLGDTLKATREAGLSTKGLEKELEGVNRQFAQSRLRDHQAALREAISVQRQAGQSTADLERRLRTLEGVKVPSFFERFKIAARESLRDIPGVGGFVRVFNGMSAAVAVGAGVAVAGIYKLTQAIAGFTQSGVAFNAQLESAQLGVAAVLKQFDQTGKFATFDDAMAASAQAIGMLQKAAGDSPASFKTLLDAYQSTVGAMSGSGITDMRKQIDTLMLLSSTAKGLGLPDEQITQESRAILTGNITPDAMLAKTLGITPEMVNSAKAAGNLYDFLQAKMAGFSEAAARAGDTLDVKWSNVGDHLQQISAQLTKPAFESLKGGAGFLDAMLVKVQEVIDPSSATKQLEDTRSAAEKAAQAVRDANQAKMEDLAKQAAGAVDEFDKLTKSIGEAYKILVALAEAQGKLNLATLNRKEQEALGQAGGDPKRQGEIKRQYADRRAREQYAAEDKQLRLQISAQESLRDNAKTRQKQAERIAERSALTALGAKAEFEVAQNRPSLTGAVRGDSLYDAAKLSEDLQALEKRKLVLEAAYKRETYGGGVLKTEATPGGFLVNTNDNAKKDIESELAAVKASIASAHDFAQAKANTITASNQDADNQKNLAKVRSTTIATAASATQQIEILQKQRAAALETARAGVAAARNESGEAKGEGSQKDRDRSVELNLLRAQATGDVRGERRAEWTKSYWAQWDAGSASDPLRDSKAREMANAEAAAREPFQPTLSSLAASGHAQGENLALARLALASGKSGQPKEKDPLEKLADCVKNNALVVTTGESGVELVPVFRRGR